MKSKTHHRFIVFLLTVIAFIGFAEHTLAQTRLAWYKLNETTGTTAANSSGAAGSATLGAAPATPVWSAGALSFDGVDDFVQTPVTNGSSRTLAAWIYPRSSDPAGGSIESVFDCDVPGNYGTGWGLNNGFIYVILDDTVWNSGVMIALNQWQHVCVTFDATTVRVYLNGALKSTLSYTQGPVTTTATYKIGRSNANALFFHGDIKDAKIYSGTVTDLQVLTIQSSEAPAPDTAPTSLSATASSGYVGISWTAANDGETWYSVSRATTAGGPYTAVGNNVVGTGFVDTNVVNGTTYYYKVAAANIAGTGPDSSYVSATPVAGTSYYVDSAGSDANNGTSEATPWKSIGKVNATTFKGGDQILFKRGGTWSGTLSPQGSGTIAAQITLGSYGTGAKPLIDGAGAGAAISIYSQSYFTIDGFEVTNLAGGAGGNRCGIRVGGGGDGSTIRKIRILNNDVHDIHASPNVNDGARNWGGIFVWIDEPGKADDVLIQGNTVTEIQGQGISFWAEFEANGMNYSNCSPNVVVRGNRVWRTSGDGLLVLGGDNELVEYNEVAYAGVLSGLYNNIAAAWPSRHRDGVWQYNHVHHTKWLDMYDSTAFDNDGYVDGTTYFQYNYTHDNEGGFNMEYFWVWDTGKTVSRYNLSVNDGRNGNYARVYFSNRPGSQIYNNVFYNPGMMLDVQNGGENTTYFYNNIFVGASRTASFDTQGVYYNNHFFGGVTATDTANGNVTQDPKFVDPNLIHNLAGFILQSTSPCRSGGLAMANNGGKDFWSATVPASPTTPYRGMSQLTSSSGDTATPSYVHFTPNGTETAMNYSTVLPASGTSTSTFSVIVHDQNFRPMTSPTVAWSIQPALAGYSIDSNGVLTLSAGAQPQRVAIVAQSGSATNTFSLTVLPADASSSWTNASGGDWLNAANWQDGVIANGIDQTSTFALSTDVTVNQASASRTIGHLAFSNANHTIAGNTLTLDVASGTPTVTVAGSTTATLATPVNGSDGLIKSGAGTLTFSGGLNYSGATTINGGELSNGAAAGTSYALGTLTLNGGTLAAANAGHSTYGNFQLGGEVTVTGTAQSVISADVRVGNSVNRIFNVANTGDASGVDLLVSGYLSHYSGQTWGFATKTGAGTMKLTRSTAIGSLTVSEGKLIFEDAGAEPSLSNGGLTNNSQVEFSVTGGNTFALGVAPSGSGTYLKSGTGTLNLGSFGGNPASVAISGGTLHMTGGHNNYSGVTTTTIGAGGRLSNNTHTHVKDITFAGGELASTATDPTYGGWMFDNNVTVTDDSGTSTLSASQVAVANDNSVVRTFTVGANATLNVTGNFIDAPTTSRNGLAKSGAGTMILAGGNTYSGQTDIQVGTLVAAHNVALGAGGHDGNNMSWIKNGATLALQGGVSINEHFHFWGNGVGELGSLRSLSGNNSLTDSYCLRSDVAVGVDADTLTVASLYQDGGTYGLTKKGAGTLAVSAFSYTGNTTVEAGTLRLGAASLADTSTVSIASSAVLDLAFSGSDTVATLFINGVQQPRGTWSATRDATHFAGTGSLVVTEGPEPTGNGTWTSTSDGNWSSSGSWQTSLIANGADFTATFNQSSASTLTLDTARTIGNLSFSNGNSTIAGSSALTLDVTSGSPQISVASGTTATITAPLAGNDGLAKSGDGTLVLSSSNLYAGETTINGGTLAVSALAAPLRHFDASALALANGGGVSNWSDLSGNAAHATVPTGNQAPTYLADAGTGTGLGAVNFLGNSGASNSQALKFVRATDVRSVFSVFKGSSFLMTDSETYALHRLTDTNPADPLLQDYGQINYLGTVRVNGTAVADPKSSAMPTDSHNGFNLIALVGNGTSFTLDSFNKDRSYHSGNQLHAETILFNTVIDDARRSQIEAYLTKKWFGTGDGTGDLLPTTTAATLSNGGALDLSGVNHQTLVGLTSTDGQGSIVRLGTASLTLANSAANTFDGTISGAGSLVKAGSGTLTFTGANRNTGPTWVNEGTLQINGTQTSATGAITVAANAKLGGTGSVGGAVTVQTNGILAPGASFIGTLTAPAATISGTLAIEIDGSSVDRLNVIGNLNITNATLAFTGTPTAESLVISSFGSLTGSAFSSITGLPGGYEIQFDSTNGQILLAKQSSFASWVANNYPTLADPAANADPDSDGIPNALEYVLGGNLSQPSSGIAPTATSSGGNLLFTFQRTDASETSDITLVVEAGTTLTTWLEIFAIGATTETSSSGVGVQENAAAPDTITVTIPNNNATAKFARLRVRVAP